MHWRMLCNCDLVISGTDNTLNHRSQSAHHLPIGKRERRCSIDFISVWILESSVLDLTSVPVSTTSWPTSSSRSPAAARSGVAQSSCTISLILQLKIESPIQVIIQHRRQKYRSRRGHFAIVASTMVDGELALVFLYVRIVSPCCTSVSCKLCGKLEIKLAAIILSLIMSSRNRQDNATSVSHCG